MPEWAASLCNIGYFLGVAAFSAELMSYFHPTFARAWAKRLLARAYARDNYRRAYREEIEERTKEFAPPLSQQSHGIEPF